MRQSCLFRALSVLGIAAILAACSRSGSSGTLTPSVVPATQSAQGAEGPTRLSNGDLLYVHFAKPFGAHVPSGNGPLIYYGGPVQNTPTIYLDLWGFKKYGDPSKEAPYLERFLNGIGGSSWLNIVTQYYSGSGGILNPQKQLVSVWSDETNPIPASLVESDVANEAQNLVNKVGYNADASYIVATPHDHNVSWFPKKYCSVHAWVQTKSGIFAYTDFPYNTDAPVKDGKGTCGEGMVNGEKGLLDGVSMFSGHELAETQTDPVFDKEDAWEAADKLQEVADLCQWVDLANIKLATGTFAVQSLWSNADNGCVLSDPVTFNYTGAQQNFTVPAGVKHVTIYAYGAGQGSVAGGLVSGTIAVTPGESLAVFVGGTNSGSTGGFNGGGAGSLSGNSNGFGGSGASDVRRGGNALSNRVIVAGGTGGTGGAGGGGSGYEGGAPGDGGGLEGIGGGLGGGLETAGFGGGGGSQKKGGTGGIAGSFSGLYEGGDGIAGVIGAGGNGGSGGIGVGSGSDGGGGGGGGGGYYGGGGGGGGGGAYYTGGGGGGGAGGGGGGSGWIEASATHKNNSEGGGSVSNGKILISW